MAQRFKNFPFKESTKPGIDSRGGGVLSDRRRRINLSIVSERGFQLGLRSPRVASHPATEFEQLASLAITRAIPRRPAVALLEQTSARIMARNGIRKPHRQRACLRLVNEGLTPEHGSFVLASIMS